MHFVWRSSTALISTRREYGWLFSIYVPIAAVVFGLVVGAILLAVLGYRRRSRAARRSENNPLEGAYAVVLAGVVGFLLYLTFTAEHQVDTVANQERPSLTVDVTAAQVGVGVSLSAPTGSSPAAGPSATSRSWSPRTRRSASTSARRT